MNPLEAVQSELAAAIEQRAEIERKIQALQESAKVLEPIYAAQTGSVRTLQYLAGLGDIKDLGITAAVERVLTSHPNKWLPPTSVRNGLIQAGFSLTGNNPLASIHQVLKRLVDRGTWFVSEEVDGQTMYQFDANRVPSGAYRSQETRHPAYMAAASSDPLTTPPANIIQRLRGLNKADKE